MLKHSRLQFVSGLALAILLGFSAGGAVAAEKLKVAILVPGLANDGSLDRSRIEGVKN